MAWTWRFQDGDGATPQEPAPPMLSSQSDAESWLGEHWRGLRDSGVAAVTLLDGGTVVYGPMPLSED